MANAQLEPLLERARAVAGGLAQRAEEIEACRRLPDDVLKDLASAGCLRMLVPSEHGGPGHSLPEALRLVELLSRADGATGWTVGQITVAQLIFGCFPKETRTLIYADGPDTLGAGAVAPKGRATAEGDMLKVNGQWPYVTGCWYSSWTYLTCVLVDGHAVRIGPDGVPQTCMVVVPSADLEIIDTWRSLGLRGTASHDTRARGCEIPAARSLVMGDSDPGAAAVRYRVAQAGLMIAAVAVGLAQGAIDDAVALAAGGKRPAFGRRPLSESPLFQDGLGDAQATCAAARALLYAEAEAAAARPDSGPQAPGALERATLRAVAAKVSALALEAVDTAHRLAGGTSVYQGSALERRLRDMHTASQHFVSSREHYGVLGALLAGTDTGTPV